MLRRLGILIGLIAIVLVVTLPYYVDDVATYKFGLVLIAFVAAIGLHVLLNWAGELSLAQGAMVGVPSLVVLTISQAHAVSPIYLVPLAMVVGTALGAVVALPVWRAKGEQVAIVTLVAGIAIEQYAYQQSWLVGDGIRSAAVPTLGPWHFGSSESLYPVLLVFILFAVVVTWVMMHSKVARSLYWLRSHADAASAFGVPVVKYRIGAYAVGGAFGGMAGGLLAMWVQRVGPTSFPATRSFDYLLLVVLAGPGFLGGLAQSTLMLQGGVQFNDIFGTNLGHTLDALITYGGVIALIYIVVKEQAGFNGYGRRIATALRARYEPRPAVHEESLADAASGEVPAGPVVHDDLPQPNGAPDALSEIDAPPVTPVVAGVAANGEECADAARGPVGGEPLLTVSGVSVSFGGLRALQDVSLVVPRGATVGLIGPNGAGKTTCFNVITGLQRASSGSVNFDGHELMGLAPHRRAKLGMGRSFQHLGLMQDETVATNLVAAQYRSVRYRSWDIYLRPWRRKAEERRLLARAEEVAAKFGLTDVLDTTVRDLSFGVARFVELAGVFAEQPSLMLLDEPTTGLDTGETRRLLELLRQVQAEGTTVLLVAHDVRFVMDLCDHIYVLASGQCLFDGVPAAVQQEPAVIEAYLGSTV